MFYRAKLKVLRKPSPRPTGWVSKPQASPCITSPDIGCIMNNKTYRFVLLAIISVIFSGCAVQEKMSISEQLDLQRQPQLEAMVEEGLPIAIHALGPTRPDSAGGVNVRFTYYPLAGSSNPIKYLRLTVTPYNAVGDIVSSTVSGKAQAELLVTGPLHGHERSVRASFSGVWYNHSIDRIYLNKLEVEMMDGTIYTYIGSFHDLATSNFKLFFNDDGSSTGYKVNS